jgi:hypothetical protein
MNIDRSNLIRIINNNSPLNSPSYSNNEPFRKNMDQSLLTKSYKDPREEQKKRTLKTSTDELLNSSASTITETSFIPQTPRTVSPKNFTQTPRTRPIKSLSLDQEEQRKYLLQRQEEIYKRKQAYIQQLGCTDIVVPKKPTEIPTPNPGQTPVPTNRPPVPTQIPTNTPVPTPITTNVPIPTPTNVPIQPPVCPPPIQFTPEIIKQLVNELGKQSPEILQHILKEITKKATEYLHPTQKDPREEQKRTNKTSTTELISPLDMLASKIENYTDKIKENFGVSITRLGGQIKIPTTYKYIDIDSTYRNRNLYPDPCNFIIPFTEGAPGGDGLSAEDPVFLAYPILSINLTTMNAPSGNSQTISFSSSIAPPNYNSNIGDSLTDLVNNYYYNYILEIEFTSGLLEYRTITSSRQSQVTVSPPFSIIEPNRPTRIRKSIPMISGSLPVQPILPGGNISRTEIKLSSNASDIDNFYKGNLFVLYSSGDYKVVTDSIIISEYNGSTKIATLKTGLSLTPTTGLKYEIDKFSYDNMVPLRNTGSRAINQARCYDIILLHLAVPFNPNNSPNNALTILGGNGGTLRNYPYLYVHFYNENRHSQYTIYGNNPNASLVTFKVTMDNPIFGAVANSVSLNGQFAIFNNINVTAPQNIKISTTESLRFKVTLPNGDDLKYAIPDYFSPLPPNPRVQFSALIALNPVPTSAGSDTTSTSLKINDGYEY